MTHICTRCWSCNGRGLLQRRPGTVGAAQAKRHAHQPRSPLTTGAPQGALSVPASSYPSIRRDASVVETLHGEEIADPYRWLEDPDSKETEAFVEKQNVLTASVLAQCKTRDKFKKLMTELYDYPRFSCPSKQGER